MDKSRNHGKTLRCKEWSPAHQTDDTGRVELHHPSNFTTHLKQLRTKCEKTIVLQTLDYQATKDSVSQGSVNNVSETYCLKNISGLQNRERDSRDA